MNRRNAVLLAVLLLVLIALVAFFLYLSGGTQDGSAGTARSSATSGVIHIRSIYTADGENLRRPVGLGADDDGAFFITLKDDARVIRLDRDGDFLGKFGEKGIKQGQMLAPLAVVSDRLANQVYVVDRARLRIICYDLQGRFQWERAVLNPVGITRFADGLVITTFGPIVHMSTEGETLGEVGSRGFEKGQFDYARAAVQVSDEDIVVADTNNTRVTRIRLSGESTAVAKWVTGTPPRFQDDPDTVFGVPSGVTVDDQGRIFVLDGFRHKIDVMDPATGKIIHSFTDLQGKADGQFNLPTGIANLGGDRFAITDTFNDRVQIVRLILPAENTLVNRERWLLWLLPLLLLPLLLLARRRRVYATREALDAAAERGDLRLLLAVYRKLRVLPEVAEAYRDVTEDGVTVSEYLVEITEHSRRRTVVDAVPDTAADDAPADAESRLARASRPSLLRRLLLARDTVVCGDDAQCGRMEKLGSARTRDVDSVTEEYRLDAE